MSALAEHTFLVTGMSCGHCTSSVAAEVAKVAGVSDVEVVLESGLLTVRGEDVDDDAVRAAVDEAGYEAARRLGS